MKDIGIGIIIYKIRNWGMKIEEQGKDLSIISKEMLSNSSKIIIT